MSTEEELDRKDFVAKDICSICLNNIFNDGCDGDDKFVTSCNHYFHFDCLEKWCKKNNSCPKCRKYNVMPIYVTVSSPNLNSLTMPISVTSTATTVSHISPNYNSDIDNFNNILNAITDQTTIPPILIRIQQSPIPIGLQQSPDYLTINVDNSSAYF